MCKLIRYHMLPELPLYTERDAFCHSATKGMRPYISLSNHLLAIIQTEQKAIATKGIYLNFFVF